MRPNNGTVPLFVVLQVVRFPDMGEKPCSNLEVQANINLSSYLSAETALTQQMAENEDKNNG